MGCVLRDSITSQARPKLTRQPHFCNVVIICCHIFVVTCVTLLSSIIKYEPLAIFGWLHTQPTTAQRVQRVVRTKLSRRYKPSNQRISQIKISIEIKSPLTQIQSAQTIKTVFSSDVTSAEWIRIILISKSYSQSYNEFPFTGQDKTKKCTCLNLRHKSRCQVFQ